MITELKLSKPITVHGKSGPETVSVLKISEPTGDVLLNHGMPYATMVTPDPKDPKRTSIEMRMVPAVFREYLKAMTGLDSIAVGQIPWRDMNTLYNAIMSENSSATPGEDAEGN